jgi:hypothetical protein
VGEEKSSPEDQSEKIKAAAGSVYTRRASAYEELVKIVEANMTTAPINDDKLKDLLKTAIIELFEERRDVVRELIAEALEDVALVRAIDEGARTEVCSDLHLLSEKGLSEAFGEDEPEYSLDFIKEANPVYERR